MADGSNDLTTADLPATDTRSRILGHYRLTKKLGEGGMGEVWAADQTEPVRRRVAIKLIKRGMDSAQVVARFESERQALALMNHPNIAQVFDAGLTESGRSYFVMEYVPGVPVTDYCDVNRLSNRNRLELFLDICEGLQHAHQKGVIHRDVKPSNVLVTLLDGAPIPKIIDFGLAKATDHRLTERTLYTQLGQAVGTPEYMSPEQAEMTAVDVDTRTDIYSLGVLLYELLVGARPFDSEALRQAGYDEMRRKIREDEPLRPSKRLSTLGDASSTAAANRRQQPAGLRKELRGDLDWITMKALEKDRTRRYPSVSGFGADIRRYLRHEPVAAGPPSTTYRMRKFVRRHTGGVVAGTVLLLTVVLGAIGTTVGMVKARNAEQVARTEAETARRVSDFLVGLFEVADPSQEPESVSARDMLDRGAGEVQGELSGQPLIQARLLSTMGRAYRGLGLYEQASRLLSQAVEIREQHEGSDDAELGADLSRLAGVLRSSGELPEAQRLAEQALAIQEKVLAPTDPLLGDTHHVLGAALFVQRELEEAGEHYSKALEIRELAYGPQDLMVAQSLEGVALVADLSGDYEKAGPLYQRSLAIHEETLGPQHPKVASSLTNLAIFLTNTGNLQQAQPLFERALAIREETLGAEHPDTGYSYSYLATFHANNGDYTAAEPLWERCLEVHRKSLGADHPSVAYAMTSAAITKEHLGDLEGALELHKSALALHRQSHSSNDHEIAYSLANLAAVQRKTGDTDEARAGFEQALQIFQQVEGANSLEIADVLAGLGSLDRDLGNYPESKDYFSEAVSTIETHMGTDHPDLVVILEEYAELHRQMGEPEISAQMEARAAAIREKTGFESSEGV